jgi:FAD/FMN-containing dehydrogenase
MMSVDALTASIKKNLGESNSKAMAMYSVWDNAKYNEVRSTWNRRNAHLPYPDLVVLPESAQQVSIVVQCAAPTGHRVCGCNGKHSFEGDSCTYGIVVDVSANLRSTHVIDASKD